MLRCCDLARLPRRWAAFARALLVAVAGVALAASAWSAELPTYRLFLLDGTALVSYGEVTRAGSRAVFAVPLGSASDPSAMHVVSLPDHLVDWARTNRYTDAVRLHRYASTRGDDDYRALTDSLARALSDMAFATGPEDKLRIALAVRRDLVAWPATHFGYRTLEVRELTAILDEAISDVRASAGAAQFAFELVATVDPPDEPLLPEPTARAVAESALTAARASDFRSERVSLQQSILLALGQRPPGAADPWVRAMQTGVKSELDQEFRLDRRYADLTGRTTRKAVTYASAGDVAALERLVADVHRQDTDLGHRRPEDVQVLLASLAAHLDTARSNRLTLDRWQMRTDSYGDYRRAVDATMKELGAIAPDIDAVRRLAGPDPRRLVKTDSRLASASVALLPLGPPLELREAHDTLRASIDLMKEATRLRREALASGSMDVANNASAAAAGALMLLENARGQIAEYFRRPLQP